jgi:hypothetical protein
VGWSASCAWLAWQPAAGRRAGTPLRLPFLGHAARAGPRLPRCPAQLCSGRLGVRSRWGSDGCGARCRRASPLFWAPHISLTPPTPRLRRPLNRPLHMCTAGVLPEAYRSQAAATPRTGSFVHLHLGIDGEGLPPDLGIHHLIVNRWSDFEASKGRLSAWEEVWEGGGGGNAYCLSRRGRGCAAGQASGRLPGEGRPQATHVLHGKRVAGGAGRPARAAALPLAAGCTVGSGLQTLSRTHRLLSSVPAAQAPQNVCNVSIPSTLDPSLAPPGKHVVHAYTGGCPRRSPLLPPLPPAATAPPPANRAGPWHCRPPLAYTSCVRHQVRLPALNTQTHPPCASTSHFVSVLTLPACSRQRALQAVGGAAAGQPGVQGPQGAVRSMRYRIVPLPLLPALPHRPPPALLLGATVCPRCCCTSEHVLPASAACCQAAPKKTKCLCPSSSLTPLPLPPRQEERSQCLWAALERVIPDVRQRAEVKLVGTPLTHERYLRWVGAWVGGWVGWVGGGAPRGLRRGLGGGGQCWG